MAGVGFTVNSGEVALVAATAKTVLQVKAATNQRVLIKGLKFLGKQAAGGTDAVCKVRMTRNSANFGTAGSTPVAGKLNPSNGETLQTTFGANFSAEPTTPTDSGLWWEVQPQGGIIEALPPGSWIEIPGGQSVQFEFTSTGTPTVLVTVTGEE